MPLYFSETIFLLHTAQITTVKRDKTPKDAKLYWFSHAL